MKLAEMQFELLETEDAVDNGFAFGIDLEEAVTDDGFDPGGTDWTTQDTENPTRGFTQFGIDNLQGPTWAFQCHVDREDTVGALDTMARSKTAWRARKIANSEGAVTALRYCLGGRTRRVYGRPRGWTGTPNNLLMSGFVPITKDFKCVDGYTYDDEIQSVTVMPHIAAPPTMKFPLKFPLAAVDLPDTNETVWITGDAVTYPVITFRGPITNPYLTTKDWTLSLKASLAAGDFIRVDLRPWHLTVMRNDTEPVPGALSRTVWLEDLFLEPGENTFAFGGTGSTSGAFATLDWRGCYNAL